MTDKGTCVEKYVQYKIACDNKEFLKKNTKNYSIDELESYLVILKEKISSAYKCYTGRLYVFEKCYSDRDPGHKKAIDLAKEYYDELQREYNMVKNKIIDMSTASSAIDSIDNYNYTVNSTVDSTYNSTDNSTVDSIDNSIDSSFNNLAIDESSILEQESSTVPVSLSPRKKKKKKKKSALSKKSKKEDLTTILKEHDKLVSIKQEREKEKQYKQIINILEKSNLIYTDVDVYNLYMTNMIKPLVDYLHKDKFEEVFEHSLRAVRILFDNKPIIVKNLLHIKIDSNMGIGFIDAIIDKTNTVSQILHKFIKIFKFDNSKGIEYTLGRLTKLVNILDPSAKIGDVIKDGEKLIIFED